MKRTRLTPIFSALLLFMLSLHTLTHSLILPGSQLTSLQNTLSAQVACTDSIAANDMDEQAREGAFKPPKHSFIDYSTYLSPNFLLPGYHPRVSRLLVHEPFQRQPKVYLEIVVPPDPA